jgi:hypothetical protein
MTRSKSKPRLRKSKSRKRQSKSRKRQSKSRKSKSRSKSSKSHSRKHQSRKSSQTIRNDPELWEKVVKIVKKGDRGGQPGEWSARKAQLAVSMYKDRGGTYSGSRKNSLSKWTDEEWDYIDGIEGNRYLPKSVREKLDDKEKRIENRRKKEATSKGKQRARYSKSVLEKMRKR